jgi:hypothetical protein
MSEPLHYAIEVRNQRDEVVASGEFASVVLRRS